MSATIRDAEIINDKLCYELEDGSSGYVSVENAIDALREIAQLRDELDGHKDYYKRVMLEQCAPDEQHCTCVPALRARLEAARRTIVGMQECVAHNAGIRNEYQDFDEVHALAEAWLKETPSP